MYSVLSLSERRRQILLDHRTAVTIFRVPQVNLSEPIFCLSERRRKIGLYLSATAKRVIYERLKIATFRVQFPFQTATLFFEVTLSFVF